MSNPLTGDFDAAVEVRVETLNRILATLHQKKAFEGASPSLLHSVAARVGEVAGIGRDFEAAGDRRRLALIPADHLGHLQVGYK